ncbi:hypothetical protein BCD_0853 (plasmid) [Borrelia crocidurae DOU]|uniref:Uncharacterized protein n=1 Tax=Borrelia crocidurae DOU TaxID=1293575 RepID=W5SIE0_9SPIR|nr:hypothetical protein BCD_0853 [Borrelia crocidurae DOU]
MKQEAISIIFDLEIVVHLVFDYKCEALTFSATFLYKFFV